MKNMISIDTRDFMEQMAQIDQISTKKIPNLQTF
jgi:hypothetical protein